MRKWIIAIVIAAALIPVIPMILPKPVTFERVEAAFKQKGYAVSGVHVETAPMLGAAGQVNMIVDGAQVALYRFDSEGKITTQLEYQKPDAGSAIVETWNLRESLGAAPPRRTPLAAARNGLFLITVASDNAALRRQLVALFKGL